MPPLPKKDALEYIQLLKDANADIIDINYDMVVEAIESSCKHKLSYWDSLIVIAATVGGCEYLISEDMRHGQRLFGLEIVNPFI